MTDWEKKARDLQLKIHTMAADAEVFAEPYRGTSNPTGFGAVRAADTLKKVARLADEEFGIHPDHPGN